MPVFTNCAVAYPLTDSVNSQKTLTPHYRLTARIHSLGVFAYGGMIANSNPSFDINITYNRKHYSLLFLKGLDLYDLHSSYNFTLLMANIPCRITKSIAFVPCAGFVVDQTESIIGKDSDGVIFLITTWKRPNGITFEHCGRFSNICFRTQYFDWLNRFRVSYTYHHFDMVASLWHNNNVFDRSKHTSVGISLSYNRVKVSEYVSLSTALTAIKMTACTDSEALSTASGIALTIAATLN